MSNYLSVKTYKVYTLITKNEYPSTVTVFEDTTPHIEPLNNYSEAEEWININGKRQVAYSIVEIFRKS